MMLRLIKKNMISRKIIRVKDSEAENSCRYISSRGIQKSCDYFPIYPKSGFDKVRNIEIKKLKDRNIIYIQNSALDDFYSNYFKKIETSFVLVSGDSDDTMPFDRLSEDNYLDMISNKKCIHWFCQNMALIKQPKITIIPAGLDYHTITYSHRPHKWGPWLLPIEQDKQIDFIRSHAAKTEHRKIQAYSTFHFYVTGRYGQDRIDAINKISKDAIFYEPEPVDRQTSWERQSLYSFVASPLTNGLDAHRTWEALVLGCIPIVKNSPIINVFEDLPVLIVNDWKEVTLDRLQDFLVEYEINKDSYNYEKLTLAYWINKIRSKANITTN